MIKRNEKKTVLARIASLVKQGDPCPNRSPTTSSSLTTSSSPTTTSTTNTLVYPTSKSVDELFDKNLFY